MCDIFYTGGRAIDSFHSIHIYDHNIIIQTSHPITARRSAIAGFNNMKSHTRSCCTFFSKKLADAFNSYQGNETMVELHLSSAAVIQVIQSWEISRQRDGFEEQLGIDTLMLYVTLMFELPVHV